MGLRRPLVISVLLLAVLGLSAFVAIAWWSGSDVAYPPRRPLHDYHTEFLHDPSGHGVRLERFTSADGTPCLVLEPVANTPPSARGARVREQLGKGTVALPPPGQIVGTLVLLHGRRGRKEDHLLIAERFCAVGFRCLIPDLPGHGDHPLSGVRYGVGESSLPGRVLREAAARFNYDPRPAGLLGLSMGGSVAIHSAVADPQLWNALIVLASFDSLQSVIRQQAVARSGPLLGGLWADSAGLVYESRTGQRLAEISPGIVAEKIAIPTLVAHGTKDSVIPLQAGRALFEALPPAIHKSWIEIPGAGHDNILITDFPLYATLAEWMLRWVAGR